MAFEKLQVEIDCVELYHGINDNSIMFAWDVSAIVHDICFVRESFEVCNLFLVLRSLYKVANLKRTLVRVGLLFCFRTFLFIKVYFLLKKKKRLEKILGTILKFTIFFLNKYHLNSIYNLYLFNYRSCDLKHFSNIYAINKFFVNLI